MPGASAGMSAHPNAFLDDLEVRRLTVADTSATWADLPAESNRHKHATMDDLPVAAGAATGAGVAAMVTIAPAIAATVVVASASIITRYLGDSAGLLAVHGFGYEDSANEAAEGGDGFVVIMASPRMGGEGAG